jgi:hypothetical protein
MRLRRLAAQYIGQVAQLCAREYHCWAGELMTSLRRRRRLPLAWTGVSAMFIFAPCSFGGPIIPLYLTGAQSGGGQPNTAGIKVVQGSSVTNAWDQVPLGTPQSPSVFALTVLALASSIGALSALLRLRHRGHFPVSDYLHDCTTDGANNCAPFDRAPRGVFWVIRTLVE